jgi:membrane-bound lytic murein transglycosylase D
MKRLFSFLFTIYASFGVFAQTQISIPEVPKKIEFANIVVELTPEAQKLVTNEVVGLLTPQNKFLELKLERMQWYFPIIEKVLQDEDLPEDFKYLAVMESSLLPEALSSSNAVGFWQFKEATGVEAGLVINNNVDERKNIHEATKAAATYLKKNNLIFKNWISCMLSYNLGVQGASEKIPVEWSFANEVKFDENTHPYLIKALANRIAFEHRLNRLKDSPRKFVEYPTQNKSFAEIAVELTVDINDLRKYNPWLYGASLPNDKIYKILILSKIEDVDELNEKIKKRTDFRSANLGFPRLKRITMVSTSPDSPIFYEINGKKGILSQPGEEAAQMAAKAKVKLKKFLAYNDMTEKDITKEGNVYYLQSKSKKAATQFHTARPNQTLSEISQMYGVKLKALLSYNRMKATEPLQAGRVIWMQKTRPKNQAIEIIKEAIEQEDKLPIKENYEKKPDEVAQTKPEPKKSRFEELEPTTDKPVTENPVKPVLVPETKKEEPKKEEPKKVEPKKEEVKKEETKDKPTVIVKNTEPMKNDDSIFGNKTEKTKPASEPTKKPIGTTSVTTRHMVKQGETLFSISKKYGLTVDQLRKLNNMSPSESLKYNQILIVSKDQASTKPVEKTEEAVTKAETPKKTEIPATKPAEKSSERPSVKPAAGSVKTHTVGAGETMFSISKKYGITVKELQQLNGISDYAISAGETLIVGKSGDKEIAGASKSTGTEYHKVQAGETLFSISRKYDVSVSDLRKWNNLSGNDIKIGERIIVRK